MNNLSLSDIRKEKTVRSKCLKYNVPYAPPDASQTDRNLMRITLAKQKKAMLRELKESHLSESEKRLQLDAKAARKRHQRANLSEETKQAECAKRKLKRAARIEEVKKAESDTRKLKRSARPKEVKKAGEIRRSTSRSEGHG